MHHLKNVILKTVIFGNYVYTLWTDQSVALRTLVRTQHVHVKVRIQQHKQLQLRSKVHNRQFGREHVPLESHPTEQKPQIRPPTLVLAENAPLGITRHVRRTVNWVAVVSGDRADCVDISDRGSDNNKQLSHKRV